MFARTRDYLRLVISSTRLGGFAHNEDCNGTSTARAMVYKLSILLLEALRPAQTQ